MADLLIQLDVGPEGLMAYIVAMPIDDERAAWLTGLRTANRTLNDGLAAEVAGRENTALHLRIVALEAQVAGLRGAVRVRDELLQDHRVAIGERDVRIEALLTRATEAPASVPVSARAAHLVRRAARVPGRLARSAARVTGR